MCLPGLGVPSFVFLGAVADEDDISVRVDINRVHLAIIWRHEVDAFPMQVFGDYDDVVVKSTRWVLKSQVVLKSCQATSLAWLACANVEVGEN